MSERFTLLQKGSFERRWKTSSSLTTLSPPARPMMTFHISEDSSSGSGDGSGDVERFLMRVDEERAMEGLRREKVFLMRF